MHETLQYADSEDKTDLKLLIKKLDGYYLPKQNITYERHVFNTTSQEHGQSIDNYVTLLKKRAQTCEFGELTDSLIKDRLVVGMKKDSVRAKLLRETNLDLPKAIDICRAAEQSQTQMDIISGQNLSVNAVKAKDRKREKTSAAARGAANAVTFLCRSCGREHAPRQCPAYGKECSTCGRKHHFPKMCRTTTHTTRDGKASPRKTPRRSGRQKLEELHLKFDESDTDEDELYIGELTQSGNAWYVNLTLMIARKKGTIKFKLDTGAQCNVIPEYVFKQYKCLKGPYEVQGKTDYLQWSQNNA